MKHALWLLTRSLLALFVGSVCLLRCAGKLPTPIVTGPDTGWTRAPVLFSAHNPDGSPAGIGQTWTWGDGTSGTQSSHYYKLPGTFQVACMVSPVNGSPFGLFGQPDPSDFSVPCTLHILEDTLTFPDSLVSTIRVGPGYHVWACVVPDGSRLYIARAEVDSVSVMETQMNTMVATVAVQDSPVCCVASNSGLYVYVLNAGSGTVSVVRTSDNAVLDTIHAGYHPNSLALLPDDSLLYVGHADSSLVTVYRTDNDSCVARVALQGIPSGIAVRPGGEYVYVTSEGGNCLTVLRATDNTIVSSATLAGGPAGMTFSPDGETAYVACPASRDLALLRTSNLSTVSRVTYDSMGISFPRYAAMLPDGPCLYVISVSRSANKVAVLRRSDNYLLRQYYLDATGIAGPAVPLPDRSRVYVPTSSGVFVLGLRQSR